MMFTFEFHIKSTENGHKHELYCVLMRNLEHLLSLAAKERKIEAAFRLIRPAIQKHSFAKLVQNGIDALYYTVTCREQAEKLIVLHRGLRR